MGWAFNVLRKPLGLIAEKSAFRWEARLGFLLGARIFVDSAVGLSVVEGLRGDLSAASVSLLCDDEGRDGLMFNLLMIYVLPNLNNIRYCLLTLLSFLKSNVYTYKL